MKNPFTSARIFFNETKMELQKASWPNLQELWDSTIVVIIAIILLGIYVLLADFSVYNWVTLLTDLVRGGTEASAVAPAS